jgi:lysozyme
MNTICAPGVVTSGFDVSQYQPNFDFYERSLLGDKFCFIRGCYGTTIDSEFAKSWPNSQAAGLLRGAYCYFLANQSPIQQASILGNLTGYLRPGDLPSVMDWETSSPGPQELLNALSFLQEIELLTGKTPIIYGSPYFLDSLSLDSRFLKYPLWIAQYGVQCPLVPSPWPEWSFWQHSDSNGTLDLDLFNGPLSQLQKFAL